MSTERTRQRFKANGKRGEEDGEEQNKNILFHCPQKLKNRSSVHGGRTVSSHDQSIYLPILMPRFHQVVWYGSVLLAFPLAKVGQGPKICRAEPLLFSKLLCWGTKRIRKGAEKVELDTPVDVLSTESSLLCDRGMKTNRHTTCKVFLDNGGRKGLAVHLGRPPLLLFV